MKKIKENISIILLILAIFGFLFILNVSTLRSPDDYSYANVVAGDDLKITSFSEITRAAKYFYLNWTGRIIPHILVGVFMTSSVLLFKIINTVLFVCLIIFVSNFFTRKITFLSVLTAFGFYIYGKMFGEKFLWISGSLNYLWTSVALIAYLYAIYGYFVEKHELKKWQKILIIAISPIIGFMHEVTSFVCGSFLGILFLANIKNMWKTSKKDLVLLSSSIILFGIGAFATILAPGNVARSTLDIKEKGNLLACLGNYRDIKWQIIITIVLMIVIRFFDQKELFKKEILYCVIPCLIATIPFSIMGYFPPRCFVPYEALMIITTCANIQFLEEKFINYKKVIVVISAIVSIIVLARMLPNIYPAARYIFPYKIKVTRQLEEAQRNGEKDVVVSKFLFLGSIHIEDWINIHNFFIETDSNNIVNVYTSIYYKFDKVRAISDIDYLVEIDTDITENVDYGIINKDTLELISIVTASDKIVFTIPKAQFGTYVVDCRDKDLRTHVKNVKIRGVNENIENPDIEMLINQE